MLFTKEANNNKVFCLEVYVLPGLQGDPGEPGPAAQCNCSNMQHLRENNRVYNVRSMYFTFTINILSYIPIHLKRMLLLLVF